LWAELLALTLGALSFVAAKDQGFELVLALLANVFKNRHEDRSRVTAPIRINLWKVRKLSGDVWDLQVQELSSRAA
jgi:hypothetical protein